MNRKTRLKKIALMPTQMFQSQLDQISDKGRDVLKAIEEYKFFVEQTSRVMKNDPALTEVIIGKKKNLEEASTKIYDIVFDIENLDITALYDRQQEVTDENQGIEKPDQNVEKSEEDSQEEKKPNEEPKSENKDSESTKPENKDSEKINDDKEEKK